MKKEKIILSFVATLLGLLVAALAFYFLNTKTPSPSKTKVVTASPAPTAAPSGILSLDQPKDEEVVNKKIVTISGKARSGAIIVILTNGIENVISPTISGNFSTQVTLSNGQNLIEVIGISADGETQSIKKTVTFSEEEF